MFKSFKHLLESYLHTKSEIHLIKQIVLCFFAEEETHKVDLSSLSNKLLPGLTTLGFKDDRRHKGFHGVQFC